MSAIDLHAVLDALLIGSCGMSSHINCKATFSSAIIFGFGCSLWYLSSMPPTRDSQGGWDLGEFGGQRSFSMISGQFACSHSCVTLAVCAGAPSSWKMNPAGINCLQSTISLISILFTGTHELLLLLHPCSRSDCIRILSACDTFPILTALTKCWFI